MKMDGREVFRRAVRATVDSSLRSLERAGVTADDVDLVVPHQANIRIIDAACQRLGIPVERTATVLAEHRQHLRGVDPAGAGRRHRGRPRARRRPRAARRLRSRHELGQRACSPVDRAVSRVVLVTGGAKGIGLATRPALRRRRPPRRASTYRIGSPAAGRRSARRRRATSPTPIRSTPRSTKIEEELGTVEVLVSNAGITADMLVLRMTDDDFTRVIDTNLTGGFRVARRGVQKMMRARWGRIIFIGSVVGHHRSGRAGQLRAPRPAWSGLARSLAREFACRNITVNVVAPGPDRHRHARRGRRRPPGSDRVEPCRSAASASPTRSPPPSRSSPATPAGYITGAVLPVDGGLGMGPW